MGRQVHVESLLSNATSHMPLVPSPLPSSATGFSATSHKPLVPSPLPSSATGFSATSHKPLEPSSATDCH